MSGAEHEIATVCANCGKDESKMLCKGCRLVKYCGRECQITNWPLHKKACKKRAAELHDEALFSLPPKRDDCPICFLLLPTLGSGNIFTACCGKNICSGCHYAHQLQSRGNPTRPTCPFCRSPLPENSAEMIQQLHNRLEVNDPWAFGDIGIRYFHGEGVVQDKSKAFEYFCRGAELGSADALNAVGNAYLKGNGVAKDEKKALYYEELAAMQGNNEARHNLGIDEANAGKYDRALKHWLISCGCGYGESLKGITNLFLENLASNEDYDKALKSYKNYIEEIKSDQRDEAAAFNEQFKYIEDS